MVRVRKSLRNFFFFFVYVEKKNQQSSFNTIFGNPPVAFYLFTFFLFFYFICRDPLTILIPNDGNILTATKNKNNKNKFHKKLSFNSKQF